MGRIPMGTVPKSERVAVLMTPRTKTDLTKIAAVHRTSVNNIINEAIVEYLDKHGKDIQRFNDFFGEDNLSEQ